jgi:hypothetical protein
MYIDSSKNLWEAEPDMKEIYPQLYADDESKNKELSSFIGWSLINWYHPDSKWKNLKEKEKYKYLFEDQLQYNVTNYYKKSKEKDDKYKDFLDKYNYKSDDWNDLSSISKITFTDKTEKLLVDWEDKLERRNDFLSDIQYSIDTYEMLDKMLSQTKKLWDEYLRVKKEVMTSGEGGSVEGDEEESDSEKMLY